MGGGEVLARDIPEPASGDRGHHASESIGLNGSLDPLAISADVGVDSWLLFGPTGDITPRYEASEPVSAHQWTPGIALAGILPILLIPGAHHVLGDLVRVGLHTLLTRHQVDVGTLDGVGKISVLGLAPAQDVAGGVVCRAVRLQRQGLDAIGERGRAPQAQQHDVLVVGGCIVAGVGHGPDDGVLFLEALSFVNVVLPQVDPEIRFFAVGRGEDPEWVDEDAPAEQVARGVESGLVGVRHLLARATVQHLLLLRPDCESQRLSEREVCGHQNQGCHQRLQGHSCRRPLPTGSRVLGLGQGQHVSQADGQEGRGSETQGAEGREGTQKVVRAPARSPSVSADDLLVPMRE